MTSASLIQESPPDVAAAAAGPRWSVKPATASPTGYVDGAWWPRSNDLAAEIPALLTAVAPRLGQVERVSYRLGEWATAPRRITIDGVRIRLGGFRSQPGNTVDLLSRGQRLTLLVIPPSSDQQAAEQVLAAAGRSDDTADPTALLAASSRKA